MHYVTPSLALGSLADAGDTDYRHNHGIAAVLSLLDVDFDAGEHHAKIPVADGEALPPQALAAATAFIAAQLGCGRRVLVHCRMGLSRSPAIAAGYLHEYAGMRLDEAIATVCARRPGAEPHPALVDSLYRHYGGNTSCRPHQRAGGDHRQASAALPPAELSANENPLGPSPLALAAIARTLADSHRYPDRHGGALRQTLAERLGVHGGQVVLGNGSCELLDLVARACLAPGDRAIIAVPSFLPYQSAVRKAHGEVVRVPLLAFGHDLATMAARVDERTRLVYLGSPNNPTGTTLGQAELDNFLDRLPAHVTVLVDEAYREYVTRPDTADAVACVRAGRPVIAVRTFSKLYALAGLRIGYAVAATAQVAAIDALRPHYNTSAAAQAAALAALGDAAHHACSLDVSRAGMATLVAGCAELGLVHVPSDANFLLVRSGDADRVSAALAERGVRVKSGTAFGLPEHLRISVGTAADNARCLDALRVVLAATPQPTQGAKAW